MASRRLRNPPSKSPKAWIGEIARRIASRTRPSKIVLFGSYAQGRPGPDSDVDLLVILDRPNDLDRRYEAVEDAVGDHLWPLDLLVYSRREVQSRLRMGDSFIAEVLSRGRVLHESQIRYPGRRATARNARAALRAMRQVAEAADKIS